MTEDKRFEVKNIIFDGYCIVDNTDGGYYAYEEQDLENLCETLNEFVEENQQYKAACEKYNIKPEHLSKVLDDFNEFLEDEYNGYLTGESYEEYD